MPSVDTAASAGLGLHESAGRLVMLLRSCWAMGLGLLSQRRLNRNSRATGGVTPVSSSASTSQFSPLYLYRRQAPMPANKQIHVS